MSKPRLFVKQGRNVARLLQVSAGPMGEAVRLGGGWSEPDKEAEDLPGASTQDTKTSWTMGPGFYDSKGPKNVRGGKANMEARGEGPSHLGGCT